MADTTPKWPEFTVEALGQQESEGMYPSITVQFLDEKGKRQVFTETFPARGVFVTNYEATNAAKKIKVLAVSKTGVMTIAE